MDSMDDDLWWIIHLMKARKMNEHEWTWPIYRWCMMNWCSTPDYEITIGYLGNTSSCSWLSFFWGTPQSADSLSCHRCSFFHNGQIWPSNFILVRCSSATFSNTHWCGCLWGKVRRFIYFVGACAIFFCWFINTVSNTPSTCNIYIYIQTIWLYNEMYIYTYIYIYRYTW